MCFSGWWYLPANLLLLTFYRQVVLPSSKKFVIIWGHCFALPNIVVIWYWQIKPLVKPTNIIVELPRLQYSWHDFISKSTSFLTCILFCAFDGIDWCCGKIHSLSFIGYLHCKKPINILSLKETRNFELRTQSDTFSIEVLFLWDDPESYYRENHIMSWWLL